MQTLQSNHQLKNGTDLQDAFHLFSQMSGQLESTYRLLEQRVDQLSNELASANSEKLKQLAEKEKLADRLAALHAAMPAAVIWVDKNKFIRSANQLAETIFKKDIVGLNWESLINQEMNSFNGHELTTNDSQVFSYNQQTLDDNQGQVIILTDITMNREILQSNNRQQRLAELGELTAGLAHQVRTPLASALLSIEQLSHPSISDVLRNKSIHRIETNLHHLNKLVNDMLMFARDGEFENDLVNVHCLMLELNECFKQKKYNNFELSVLNSSADLSKTASVIGSKDALLSVLISLVENAYQLASEDKVIKVIVDYKIDNDVLLVVVSDNGPGLSKQQCEQIFKPFFTTKAEGTGLGLSISRSILQSHNGSLVVTSELGKGTRFNITLPINKSLRFLHSNSQDNSLLIENSNFNNSLVED